MIVKLGQVGDLDPETLLTLSNGAGKSTCCA
jgi:hypothetical protein